MDYFNTKFVFTNIVCKPGVSTSGLFLFLHLNKSKKIMDEKLQSVFWDCYLHVIDVDNRLNQTDIMSKYERMRIAIELAKLQTNITKNESPRSE